MENLTQQQIYVVGFLIAALVFSLVGILILKRKPKSLSKPTPEKEGFEKQAAETPSKPGIAGALAKTREALNQKINELVLKSKTIDEAFLDSLEELLYTSDLGVKTVERLLRAARQQLPRGELSNLQKIKEVLNREITLIFAAAAKANAAANVTAAAETTTPLALDVVHHPEVILIVGVNGVGKTTSIGKLAHYFSKQGKTVTLIAGDTFRAAAVEQLKVWADRAGVKCYSAPGTQDPAATAFQGLENALSDKTDVVIIDTAGRLHNKENLMEEMKKVKRVIRKVIPDAPHQTLLVIDANSGQNAIQQAKTFEEAIGLTGIIVTKLDGTAKGGVIVGISEEIGVLPRFIGVGEKMGDLEPFSSEQFSKALLEM